MIERRRWLTEVRASLKRSGVTAVVGPRQAGKTTLARQIVSLDSPAYFDLEDPRSLARLAEPMTALAPLRGVVVIDEIQRRPDLFPVLRVLADRRPVRARFLILGSASPGLLRQSSETLAGRIETIALTGFGLEELGAGALRRLWRRGGFPPAWLARSEAASFVWRQQFLQTFLERDLPQLGITIPAATLLRFWTMLAHYHGGIWNAAEAARSLGVAEPTARRYLDLLTGLYMVHAMQAWGWYFEPSRWYLHAMTVVWLLFTVMLFVLEPLFLHRWFLRSAERDPEGTFRWIERLHRVLLTISLVTVAAVVSAAHGWLWF